MVKASSYSKSLMKCADCSFKNMRGEDLVSYTCKTCKKLSKKNDYVFEVSKCQQCHLAWQEKLKREKSGEISRTFRFFCSSCHQLS